MSSVLMHAVVLISALLLGSFRATPQVPASEAATPDPFQFREAFLLESRIETKTESYDPKHSENLMSRMQYGPANQALQFFAEKRSRLTTYQGTDWVNLLPETDKYRQMGGLDLAEEQYLDILEKLRKAQGPASGHLALMLDHLAEFYLEERRFNQAYKTFAEAARVKRIAIDTLTKRTAFIPASPSISVDPSASLRNSRIHLSDLLTRLGQLDLSKGDLNSANTELAEAVAIVNLPENLKYTSGLYAIYFQSRVLEKQSKWKEAENLWQEAIRLREKFNNTTIYWDAQKEMAACYARSGDFHSAAEIARNIQALTTEKRLLYEAHRDLLQNRPRDLHYDRYKLESDIAMNEIIAIDTWQTQGPEAAAALLKDPMDVMTGYMLDRGSDSERIQLLAWFQRKAFLHMSILLDGDPSQNRIDTAYTLLSKIKGRYLSSISDVARLIESGRANPRNDIREFAMLDQLAAIRESQAHLFLAAALDGKSFLEVQAASNNNKERVLSNGIASTDWAVSAHSIFSLASLSKSVPSDTAFLDFFLWTRHYRDSKRPSQREYGAFLVRKDQPIHFVRLGTVEDIDSDIDTLLRARVNGQQRSFQVNNKSVVTSAEFQQCLVRLYQKVIAPLESGLQGTRKLYIVPDGKLALAPINALKDDRGHYLLENRTIAYMDSWRDVTSTVFLGSTKSSPPVIVANPDFNLSLYGADTVSASAHRLVFQPLAEASKEAENVQKALGISNGRVLKGTSARKWLIESIQNPEILHFATHSVAHLDWKPPQSEYTLFEFPQSFDMQNPLLQSLIALAGANRPQAGPEDGLLTGLEVTRLHLEGTKLVVLSSCESGQGTLLDGQGILGLRAAFAIAGTRALVMTLWPVDDEVSRRFMSFFYSHLSEGAAEAVRLAQRDMLSKTNFTDPIFWSGYLASVSLIIEHEQRATEQQTHEPPVSSANTDSSSTTASQSFVSPNCFELLTHGSPGSHYGSISDIRIKIGGVVRRSKDSTGQVTYDLGEIGNDVEVSSYMTVDGSRVLHSEEMELASERKWSVQLIISRESNFSGISFRFGPDRTYPEKNRRITLKGDPHLFPSFEIPQVLPPLSSYTAATDSEGNGKVDKVGFCSPDSFGLRPAL
jgi:CHAT domain-containing protein